MVMDFNRRVDFNKVAKKVNHNPKIFGNSVPTPVGKPAAQAIKPVMPIAAPVKLVTAVVPQKTPAPGNLPNRPTQIARQPMRRPINPSDPRMMKSVEVAAAKKQQELLDGLSAAAIAQAEKDKALDREYAAIVKPFIPVKPIKPTNAQELALWAVSATVKPDRSKETISERYARILSTHWIKDGRCIVCCLGGYDLDQIECTNPHLKDRIGKSEASKADPDHTAAVPSDSDITDMVAVDYFDRLAARELAEQPVRKLMTAPQVKQPFVPPKPVKPKTTIELEPETILPGGIRLADLFNPPKPILSRVAVPVKTFPSGVKILTAGVEFNPMRVKSQGGAGSHLMILALAGTGKTFTVVEGGKRIMGIPTSGVRGSDQQELIWEKMCEGQQPDTIHYTAFNKSIATHLETVIPANCTASTLHSLGYRAIQASGMHCKVDSRKTNFILHDGWDENHFKTFPGLCSLCEQVSGLIKLNLLDWTFQEMDVYTMVAMLQAKYGFEASDKNMAALIEVLPYLMSEHYHRTHQIDYNDMVWWPNVKPEIRLERKDLIVVDEFQDMGKAQQGLVQKVGRRIIMVGDKNQAIYGFAGADAHAMDNFFEVLKTTPEGCQQLELTKTRRCGKAIVEVCRELVPTFEAMDDAPEGEVIYNKEEEGLVHIGEKDMVLCRTNAPLISECLKFLREGKRARMQGRDIGEDLIKLVTRWNEDYTAQMLDKLDGFWSTEAQKLMNRKFGGEAALIVLEDKIESIKAFAQGTTFTKEITDRIEKLFDDKVKEGTLFTSIHRAKGLEADTVVFWRHNDCPHPMAKSEDAKEQEYHLRYVAMSRAKNRLYLTQAKPRKQTESEYS